jgi:hypothetical protein
MEDVNLSVINATQTKAGKVVLSNASNRWWAQRYNVYNAWFFYGSTRHLIYTTVPGTFQTGAVSLLK